MASCGDDNGSPGASGGVDASPSYTVGGTVTGLTSAGLVLAQGTATVSVLANSGSFTFGSIIPAGGLYAVSVATQPAGLVCAVTSGQGTASADVTSVVVTCAGPSATAHLSATVPAATKMAIAGVQTQSSTVALDASVPKGTDGTVPLLIAFDSQQKALLVAISSADGALDATSTALAVVRMALDLFVLPDGLTAATLSSMTRASTNYASLEAAVAGALSTGRSPIESDDVVAATWAVANDVIVAFGGSLDAKALRTQLAAIPAVSNPLPYYVIDNIEPYDRFSIDNINGANNVNAYNQTFLVWEISATSIAGISITQSATPLIAPRLEINAAQLLGYYGGSASITIVNGAPAFYVTIAQSDLAKKQNLIAAITQYVLFIYKATAFLYPDQVINQCALQVATNVFNSSFPAAVTQPSAAVAQAYFENALSLSASGGAMYTQLAACGRLPTVAQLTTQLVSDFWKRINLARAGISALGTTAELFAYWNASKTVEVCKSNGQIINCPMFTDVVRKTNGQQVDFVLKFANTTRDLSVMECQTIVETGPAYSYAPGPLCFPVTLDIADQPADDQELLGLEFTPSAGVTAVSASWTFNFPDGTSTTRSLSYP